LPRQPRVWLDTVRTRSPGRSREAGTEGQGQRRCVVEPQIALLIPILAGLIGLFNYFRMMRLPDPKPSGSVEGMVLG
jgi:hypothetical protein